MESNGRREITRFALERLEESVDAALAFALQKQDNADRVTLAFDGFLTWEGERTDAIYVEAIDRSAAAHVLLAQRYKPKRLLSKLQRLGNPVLLDAHESGKLGDFRQ